MKKIDIVILISSPNDSNLLVVSAASATPDIEVPVIGTQIAIALAQLIEIGFEVDAVFALSHCNAQYALSREKCCCEPDYCCRKY